MESVAEPFVDEAVEGVCAAFFEAADRPAEPGPAPDRRSRWRPGLVLGPPLLELLGAPEGPDGRGVAGLLALLVELLLTAQPHGTRYTAQAPTIPA